MIRVWGRDAGVFFSSLTSDAVTKYGMTVQHCHPGLRAGVGFL